MILSPALRDYIPSTLALLVDDLRATASSLDLARIRGGTTRGRTDWVELAGRPVPGGAYVELRIRHRVSDREIRAGALAYRPLSCGGRVVTLGEATLTYETSPSEITANLAAQIDRWLAQPDLLAGPVTT